MNFIININLVLSDDHLLQSLTGRDRRSFNALIDPFTDALEQARYERPRLRAPGGGQKPRLLRVEDKLFYILFYFHCYPTFDVAGKLFGFNRSQANRWMHYLRGVLETVLGYEIELPGRKLESLEHFLRRCPEVKALLFEHEAKREESFLRK